MFYTICASFEKDRMKPCCILYAYNEKEASDSFSDMRNKGLFPFLEDSVFYFVRLSTLNEQKSFSKWLVQESLGFEGFDQDRFSSRLRSLSLSFYENLFLSS